MAAPSNETIVLVRFPFSDLSGSKLRPALVLAQAGRGDVVLCQITSQPYTDPSAIEISDSDLRTGSLRRTSYVRPANSTIITKNLGEIGPGKFIAVISSVISMLNNSLN